MQNALIPRVIAAVRHQWIVATLIVIVGILLAIAAGLSSHPKYAATTTVLMVASTDGSTSQQVATSTRPLLPSDLPSIATSATVLDRVRNDVKEKVPIESMRSRVRAKVSTESTIMQVEYTAPTSDRAIAGANALGNEVTRFYRELATARFDSLIADLKSQLRERRAELLRFDGELAEISKTYPYIDAKSPGSSEYSPGSVYQRLIALRTERDELQATLHGDLAAATSTHALLANAKPIALRDVLQNDVVYTRVREQYAKDLSDYKRLSSFGRPTYPGLSELRQTVDREARALDEARKSAESIGPQSDPVYSAALDAQARADGQVRSDEARVAEETRLLQQLHSQIGRQSVATTAAQLRRDHDNAEAAYSIIASRLANSIGDRAEAASTGSLVVLERAQFASRSSVGAAPIVAAGLIFLSIWLALTVAMMIDGNQEWFSDNRTIENLYGAPVIGSIL